MTTMQPFVLDGKTYNVAVTELTQSWQVLDDEEGTGRVQTGEMSREIIGTFYNYDMTIEPKAGASAAEMDALVRVLSAPVESHLCTFPYEQDVLTQRMYITSGSRKLLRLTQSRTFWGGIQLKFVAMEPSRRPT